MGLTDKIDPKCLPEPLSRSASLQSMHNYKSRLNDRTLNVIHALRIWNQQAHCFNLKQRIHSHRATAPPPRPLQLNHWPNTGIIRPHGKLFLPTHVTRGSTHGLDNQCRICVEKVLCCFHVAQRLPHCSLEEPERREMSHREKEWCWFLALPGVGTHNDFL